MNKLQRFRIETFQVFTNYRFVSNANAVTFINNGTVTFNVLNFPIAPGQSLSIEANRDEIDATEYYINFGTTLNGSCQIIRKIYINE